MHPFLLIITLLLLFSFFTTAEMKRFISSTHREKGFEAFHEKKSTTEKLKMKAQLLEIKAAPQNKDLVIEKPKKPSPKKPKEPSKKKRCYKLNFDLARPPNNSRFNLFQLFEEEKNPVKPKSQILEQLIFHLYKNAPFYLPDLEKMIVEKIIDERAQFLTSEQCDALSTLSFPDENMRQAFYMMLKGNESFPSLLNYLTFDKKLSYATKKVNFLFTSEQLLLALLDEPNTVQKLTLLQKQILDKMSLPDTPLMREEIKTMLSTQFVDILISEGLPHEELKKFFDFGVGKPGKILFITHENKVYREKI